MTTPAPSDDLLHESRISPRQWVILALCFLSNLLDGFDVVVMSFTAPAISAQWSIPADQLGLVFSAGVLGMTLGAMFIAPLADVYGRRVMVSLLLFVSGAATLSVAFAASVTHLVILRFIAGVGLGALVAAIAPLIGEYSPRKHRTVIVALVFSAGPMGPVVGGFLAANLIPTYGWESLFLGAGILTILLGALIYTLVPESMAFILKRAPGDALTRINKILAMIGQALIERLPAIAPGATRESATVTSLLVPARRSRTLLIWSTFFLVLATAYFYASWLPQVLVRAGLPQDQAIRAAAVMATGGVVGAISFASLAKWRPLNVILAIAFATGGLVAGSISLFVDQLDTTPMALLWVAMFLIGMTVMGGLTSLYTVALTIYPAQVRSTGVGWAAGLGRGGAVLSPALAGFMISAGVTTPALFVYFAIPALAAAVCVAYVKMQELP
jgi:AAHS family 4-hydroxybenzoate transporter-like MFS transporter